LGIAGYGLTNIKINYVSGADSLNRGNSANLVTLEFIGPPAIAHRNIDVHFDVTYAGSGVNLTGASAFRIYKYTNGGSSFDTVDRGHILDGLTLSGNITNYPNSGAFGTFELPDINSQWGPTLDSMYNIHLHNVSLTNAKLVRLGARAWRGPVLIDNFRSDQAFSTLNIYYDTYNGAPDLGPPRTGQYKIINSSYSNQYTVANGERPSSVVYLVGDLTLGTGTQGQTIVNTGCVGTCTATLPTAVVGLTYTFHRVVAQSLRAAPQAADQNTRSLRCQ
jgi:hypothetical protein